MAVGYSIGLCRTDTLTGKRVLTLVALPTAANTAYPVNLAGANYAVTAGKTFYPTGIYLQVQGITDAGHLASLMYADDAALVTNPVAMGYALPAGYAASQPTLYPLYFPAGVPAGKYLGFMVNATATNYSIIAQIVGYEA